MDRTLSQHLPELGVHREPGAGVFSRDVHVPGGLEERQNGHRSGLRRDRDSGDHGPGEQSDLPLLLKKGALAGAGDQFTNVDLTFLGLISYIGVIAAMVQILEMTLERFFPESATRSASSCR